MGVFLSSCSVAHLLTYDGDTRYLPTDFENIEVYSTDQIDKTYTVIGEVIANVESLDDDADKTVEYLKKKASELGADAIIKVKLTKMYSTFGRTGISGIQIKRDW